MGKITVDRISEKGYSADMVMYKAVRVTDDGKLISAFELPVKMLVEYKVGEWAYPNKEITDICHHYGIFTSKSPEVLKRVIICKLQTSGLLKEIYGNTYYAIYECEVQHPEQAYKPLMRYFFDGDAVPNLSEDDSWYDGDTDTIVVRACKLTRQLTFEELKDFYT